MRKFDALVLGGGAAGLLCAIEAGKRGRRVAVLEHADRIGKKILISGGGRCNFTNIHCGPGNFISTNEHFAKSALARYTPADFIAQVEKHRIPYHEKMLITHRGLSGPAILQISSYWEKGQSIHIDLAPDREVTEAIRASKVRNMAAARTAFQGVLPKRLAERWLEDHAPPAWNNDALANLEKQAHAWVIKPADTEGYEKAEVTAGGVDTDELSSKTMECLNIKGLFFIGEVVDVTGHLGGFNFQWAWASGAAAGRAI